MSYSPPPLTEYFAYTSSLWFEIARVAKFYDRSVDDEIRLAIETHIVKFKAEQGE